MVKVSVIVPVFNVEKYLDICLDSLFNQTFEDFEIICINDGSTNSSEEILKDFQQKDKRIIILEQQNLGPSAARNNGIKTAKGELFLLLKYLCHIDVEIAENILV